MELEFFLPMGRVTAPALTALCQQHDPLSRGGKPLGFATVQGMLKGFIDLVFEWQGRWYLLDYKSNHLGMSPADYGRPALERAMVEHRYDLQYQLYSLALHRLLACGCRATISTGILAGSSISSCAACPRGHFPCQAQPGTGAGAGRVV